MSDPGVERVMQTFFEKLIPPTHPLPVFQVLLPWGCVPHSACNLSCRLPVLINCFVLSTVHLEWFPWESTECSGVHHTLVFCPIWCREWERASEGGVFPLLTHTTSDSSRLSPPLRTTVEHSYASVSEPRWGSVMSTCWHDTSPWKTELESPSSSGPPVADIRLSISLVKFVKCRLRISCNFSDTDRI